MAAEDTNNNIPQDQGQVEGQEQEQAQAQESAASSSPSVDPEYINELASQSIQQQIAANPEMQQFLKFQQFANQDNQQELNPFAQGVSLENVTEAAQYGLNQVDQTQAQLKEYQDRLAAQEQWIANENLNRGMENFNSYWEEVYPDEDSFAAAFNNAVQASPELAQKVQQANAGVQGAFTVQDLAQVNQIMQNQTLNELLNPNSQVLDGVVEARARRKALQDQSMLSSNQEAQGGSNNTHDGISAIVRIRDN